MGFLKRLFSVRSKKNKKKRRALDVDPHPLKLYQTQSLPLVIEDSEATASRLLRSASARFAVISEFDYSPTPPLPHPINHVTSAPPITPTRTPTAQHRGTYVVKVHERTLHSCTEFPNANPSLETPRPKSRVIPMPEDYDSDNDEGTSPGIGHSPITPRDHNRLHRLRQDPSVVSLLNMYDEHGRLDSGVFSNTPSPPGEGRSQRRRTGSTLRQLMGNPSSEPRPNTGTNEGDISWAERFLQERSPSSSLTSATSPSSELRTPEDLPSTHGHLHDNVNANLNNDRHMTFLSENDSSLNSNHPIISSLEVELSINTTSSADINPFPLTSPYMDRDLEIPQRASQIFSFLTEKKKKKEGRPLPELPASALPDSANSEESMPLLHAFGSEQATASGQAAKESQENDFVSKIPRLRPERASLSAMDREKLTGEAHIPQTRGPRSSNASRASFDEPEIAALDVEPRDAFTPIPFRTRRRKLSYVEANLAFIMSPAQERRHVALGMDDAKFSQTLKRQRKIAPILYDKENSWSTHGIAPVTPVRSKPILSSGGNFTPVSPASSSEMSPVGQQIMARARTYRYGV